jgi:hypothetical protein
MVRVENDHFSWTAVGGGGGRSDSGHSHRRRIPTRKRRSMGCCPRMRRWCQNVSHTGSSGSFSVMGHTGLTEVTAIFGLMKLFGFPWRQTKNYAHRVSVRSSTGDWQWPDAAGMTNRGGGRGDPAGHNSGQRWFNNDPVTCLFF